MKKRFFNVITKVRIAIDIALLWIIRLTDRINYTREYTLNWKEIISEHEKSDMSAYDFAVYFTFNYHDQRKLHHDFNSKLFMQRDIYEGLVARKKF
ncbi:hypothetical protein [Flavobacterium sp. ASW18X]|uniref:hypothetical protein n=1 Tax=Flavobacterium sp. ASW18X TaxID=2572595 RepID=UPI0010AEE2C0|nr:hypothetical protein [Flavobacterium sp. ASW18X]TKD59037.1 hypothetical protein FBT53_14730 [Flavobacterium sp. ASW18X]